MLQMLLPLLSSLAPGLLSHLMGGDPNAEYRNRVNALLGPQNMARLTNQSFQQNVGSPGYAGAQNMVNAGVNQTGNQLQANLGRMGIGNSGTGAILSSLMPSLMGSQMGQLRTGAYNQAQNQAQNTVQSQIGALTGQMPASQTQQLFAGGLSALGPLLQQMMQRQGGMPNQTLNGMMQGLQNYQFPMPQANPIGSPLPR